MMWTRLCVRLRCVPRKPGETKPTSPTRMNTTPRILQMVFAITFVVPPWEEKVEGGRPLCPGLASRLASDAFRACGRIVYHKSLNECTELFAERMCGLSDKRGRARRLFGRAVWPLLYSPLGRFKISSRGVVVAVVQPLEEPK